VAAFVVSRPLPIEDIGDLSAELARLRETVAQTAATGLEVEYVYSVFIATEQVCLSAIDAPDAATVLEIVRRSGLPATAKVLPAVRFDRERPPALG
jgi:hypothetical protein